MIKKFTNILYNNIYNDIIDTINIKLGKQERADPS